MKELGDAMGADRSTEEWKTSVVFSWATFILFGLTGECIRFIRKVLLWDQTRFSKGKTGMMEALPIIYTLSSSTAAGAGSQSLQTSGEGGPGGHNVMMNNGVVGSSADTNTSISEGVGQGGPELDDMPFMYSHV